MTWREFVSALIGHFVWPILIVVLVLMFRGQIRQLAEGRDLKKLKAGPAGLELEWVDRQLQEAKQELAAAEQVKTPAEVEADLVEEMEARGDDFFEEMRQLAEVQPRAVILESHSRLEHLLRELVPVEPAGGNAGSRRFPSVRSLARQAESAGLITRQELSVLDELTNLRNVLAHTREPAITFEQAMSYAELARQIAISIRLAAGDVGYDQPPL